MLTQSAGLLRLVMEFILRHPLIFWACVAANVLGTVVGGWFWYGPMLQAAPVWAWYFIPDCPLASLLATIGLLGLRGRQRWPFFYALVAFACIKYGLWTVAYWLDAWTTAGFSSNPAVLAIELMLFVTHIGLFIEGLLFIPSIAPIGIAQRVGVIGIFGVSIAVDYGLGFHPPLGPVNEQLAMWIAIVLTAVLALGLLALPNTRTRLAVKQARYIGTVE